MTFVSEVESIIRTIRSTIDGDVCSRSRVVDALLDLRLAASGNPVMVEVIDGTLADVPGKTMVESSWWRERLDEFELIAMNPVEPVS